MNLIALDIETDTAADQIDPAIPAGLDPRAAAITSIALLSAHGSIVLDDDDEERLLRMYLAWLDATPPGVIVTWNGSCFDLPYLADRAARHGMAAWMILSAADDRPPKYEALPGHAGGYRASSADGRFRHCDVAYAYQARAAQLGVTWSLKPVAKAHGIRMIEVDRAHVGALSIAERMAYNLSDTVGTLALANALGDSIGDHID